MRAPTNDDLARNARAWRDVFAAPEAHLDYEEVEAYVDGRADSDLRARVDEHRGRCERCAQDIADLDAERRRASRRPLPRPILIAAAAAVLVLLFLPLLRRPARVDSAPPARIPIRDYGRADWNALVRNALATGRIEVANPLPPFPSDALRGSQDGPSAVRLEPAGTIVESQTPALTWSNLDAPVIVSVYRGETRIAESGPVSHQWTVDVPLQRGAIYQWQIRSGDAIYPAPPDPPAELRVLDARSADDLDAARRAFPNDHRILGILYGRAALNARAREELTEHLRLHPKDNAVRRILQNLRAAR